MMTISQPSRDIANQNATIRALSSITSRQAETIAQAVQTCGTAWDVQVNDDYDGYLSILVEPTDHGNEQKAFFIAGTTHRLELLEAHEDRLIEIANFSDAEAISTKLLELIVQQ